MGHYTIVLKSGLRYRVEGDSDVSKFLEMVLGNKNAVTVLDVVRNAHSDLKAVVIPASEIQAIEY